MSDQILIMYRPCRLQLILYFAFIVDFLIKEIKLGVIIETKNFKIESITIIMFQIPVIKNIIVNLHTVF
ncbi:hypothetical protein GCM10010984_28750 [Chishuiella changwenlii]|uniref:Uncharacterized protein n=1 Tax=Chishuiella changwenlii TaxID=1434701 RepID=A0ABQ1U333_9FLAO|nr:hypothetical protein GCM10010984_28750 [Chishuiella changwenlii]